MRRGRDSRRREVDCSTHFKYSQEREGMCWCTNSNLEEVNTKIWPLSSVQPALTQLFFFFFLLVVDNNMKTALSQGPISRACKVKGSHSLIELSVCSY